MSVTAKQLLREAVERLPEDATVEDAMDRMLLEDPNAASPGGGE